MEKPAIPPKNFTARDQDPISPDAGNHIEYTPGDYWEKPTSEMPKKVRFGKDISDVWTHARDATPIAKMEKASFEEGRAEKLPMKNSAAETLERQARDKREMESVYAKIKNFFGAQK